MPDCVDVIKDYKVRPTSARNCCIQTNTDDTKQMSGDTAINCYPAGIEVNPLYLIKF